MFSTGMFGKIDDLTLNLFASFHVNSASILPPQSEPTQHCPAESHRPEPYFGVSKVFIYCKVTHLLPPEENLNNFLRYFCLDGLQTAMLKSLVSLDIDILATTLTNPNSISARMFDSSDDHKHFEKKRKKKKNKKKEE